MPTRALLLSAYIKFINLFPETKATIQEVLRCDSQIRNSDVELQQRAVEYLKLSSIASTDVLVSVDDPLGSSTYKNERWSLFARTLNWFFGCFVASHVSQQTLLHYLVAERHAPNARYVFSIDSFNLPFFSGDCAGGDASFSGEGVINSGQA